jgi:ribonuclease D
MNYPLSITKDEINKYPLYIFEGIITLIETEEEALTAVKLLKNESILGFDTETRAAFRKGESYNVSLLQLATETHAYLFRLNKFPMIQELADILADPNIVKTGVAIKDDIKALKKLMPFTEENFVDLADVAKEQNIVNFGLRALTAICLKKRLSKNSKVSNWAQPKLTPAQIAYAACDAVVGFQIYMKFQEMKK